MAEKSQQKFKYLENEKELLRWNKKHFFILFKRFSMKQTTNIFMEGESPTLIFAKLCYTFWGKKFFYHNFME